MTKPAVNPKLPAVPGTPDTDEIAALLSPYHPPLTPRALEQLRTYLDLLLKWNQRMSLSAIKDPRRIVSELFGESLYLATLPTLADAVPLRGAIVDVGSGAGFPGLALKLVARDVAITLVESNKRKCTFLKEVIRACGFDGVEVAAERFEAWVSAGGRADLAVSRAVRVDGGFVALLRSGVKEGGGLVLCATTDVVAMAKTFVEPGEKLHTFPVPRSDSRAIIILQK